MDVLLKMNDFRKANKFCDVIVTVDSGYFGAHKAVLAASSDFFEECLNDDSTSLNIPVVNTPTFNSVLNFIYAGNPDITPDNLNYLQKAAEIFKLPKLTKLCQEFEVHRAQDSEDDFLQSTIVTDNNDETKDAEIANNCTEIKRTLPVPIFPITKKSEREVKPDGNSSSKQTYLDESDGETFHLNLNGDGISDDEVSEEVSVSSQPKGRTCSVQSSDFSIHVCETCNATFSQGFAYQLHLLCHDDKPAYRCDLCGQSEATNAKMKEHMDRFHCYKDVAPKPVETIKASTYYCDICKRTFLSAYNLNIHMQTHNKPIKKVLGAPREKVTHPCTVCGKVFKSKSHLRRHMVSHTGERKHCCTTCGKLFLKSDHLKRHERTHTSERPFTCEDCGKSFRDRDHLKRHQLSHSNERPYFCEICGKSFKDKSTLSSHQKSHSVASLSCEICQKKFKTTEKLKSHLSKHGQEKPHACETCGKTFPFKGRLRKHMLTHTDERPFHCEECGKQFRDNHSLRLHQKIHTGIGLHPCPECGKKFTNRFHLKRHERVHSGEKPFKCAECKRSFARVDNLEAHRRLCSGKSDFTSSVTGNALITEALASQKEPGDTGIDAVSRVSSSSPSNAIIISQHEFLTSSDTIPSVHKPPSLVNQPHYENRLSAGASKFVEDPNITSPSSPVTSINLGRNPKYFSAMMQPSYPELTVSSSANPQLLPVHHSHGFGREINEPPTSTLNVGEAASPPHSQILTFDVNATVNSFMMNSYGHHTL